LAWGFCSFRFSNSGRDFSSSCGLIEAISGQGTAFQGEDRDSVVATGAEETFSFLPSASGSELFTLLLFCWINPTIAFRAEGLLSGVCSSSNPTNFFADEEE
jgi:hypothetical protein